MIGNNVAVIADRPDSMRPGVVVTDSGLRPATTAMGAGPNPTASMGAGPARMRTDTVITETRDTRPVQPAPADRR
jgi:hypothetical protein